MAMDFLTITEDEIFNWCVENDQVDWVQKKTAEKTIAKCYTARKPKLDENGNVVLNKKGNPVYVVDKTSPVVEMERDLTFVELKLAFFDEFMPELSPKRNKTKLSMHEKAMLLKNKKDK